VDVFILKERTRIAQNYWTATTYIVWTLLLHYVRLTAFFQDNSAKPAPER